MDQQREEVEALLAIYPDEIKVISEDPFVLRMLITSSEADCSCDLTFTLPANYPNEIPVLKITTESPNMTEKSVSHMLNSLKKIAQQSLGQPSIYTLLLSTKDALEDIVSENMLRNKELLDEVSRIQREAEDKKALEDEAEEKRREGTLVVRDVFTIWKKNFDIEMAGKMKKNLDSTKKLTGKQLFEQDASLATSDALFMDGETGLSDSESEESGSGEDEEGEEEDDEECDDDDSNIDWELYDEDTDTSQFDSSDEE